MRKAFIFLLLAGTAACGQSNESPSRSDSTTTTQSDLRTFNAEEATTDAGRMSAPPPPAAPASGPNVNVTAAPGVAFNYRYAFRLAAGRIAGVQEEHAAACEKLGLTRCRITGMRYRLVGHEQVEAMLSMKVDPALARAFGKEGIAAVTRAEGMLVDAQISGEDVGSRIKAATRGQAELREELARIEAQLARGGMPGSERAELQIRVQELRDRLSATASTKRDDEELLATTPVTYEYGSGELARGFDERPPLSRAAQRGMDNFVDGLAWILILVVTLMPWLLLGLGLVWLWRRVVGPRVQRLLAVNPPAEAPDRA
jgi:hypothetical protein